MSKIFKKVLLLCVVTTMLSFGACSLPTIMKSYSAYDIAVENGFSGTEAEWLESLKGETVVINQYTSIYEEAKANGFVGTFDEFLSKYINDELIAATKNSVKTAVDKAITSAVTVYSEFITTESAGRFAQATKSSHYSAGAGVIIDLDKENGNAFVVTNFHVIYDADSDNKYGDVFSLFLYGSEFRSGANPSEWNNAINATFYGGSATYDIALLKVENSDILRTSIATQAEYRSSDEISVGESAIAIGNPEAEGFSVTSGIISVDSETISMSSSVDETQSINYRVMRIDTAVNSGNSGGGLFDNSGRLIGIVNAKIISDDVENISYAIPSSLVMNVIDNIKKNCDGTKYKLQVVKCVIGVTIKATDALVSYEASTQRIKVDEKITVDSIVAGSPADGKFQVNDIIKSFKHGEKVVEVNRIYNLTEYLLCCAKNDKITYMVDRGGETIDVEIVLSNANAID